VEDYKSNSDKARQEQSEKKVEAVITGAAKTRKKGEMQKFADVFIAEDANNVKSYILMEVIVVLSKVLTNGILNILDNLVFVISENTIASVINQTDLRIIVILAPEAVLSEASPSSAQY